MQATQIILALILTLSLSLIINAQETSTVTDIDGNEYKTVKIGDQWWMAENLRVTKYRNGEIIPNVTDNTQWSNLNTGAWAYYNNDSSYDEAYGKLYNWYAVANPRGICPNGWHVPSDSEWDILNDFLGDNAGGKIKSITGWRYPNKRATDEYGFSGLPGGFRRGTGIFSSIDYTSFWWSSTQGKTELSNIIQNKAYYRSVNYNANNIIKGDFSKRDGFSVRCIKY